MPDFLLHVLAGAGVGAAIDPSGVGGGSLMTPLLIMLRFASDTGRLAQRWIDAWPKAGS